MGTLGKLKKTLHFVGTGAKLVATSRPAKGLAVAIGSVAGLAKYPVAMGVFTVGAPTLGLPISIAKGMYDAGAETWQMAKTDPVQKAIDNYKFQPPLTPATHLPLMTTDKKGKPKIEITSARQAAEKIVSSHNKMANLLGPKGGKGLATAVGQMMDDLARKVQTAPDEATINKLVAETKQKITDRVGAGTNQQALLTELQRQADQLGNLAKIKHQRTDKDQKAFNSAYDYLADYCRKNPKDQATTQAFQALLTEPDPAKQLQGMQERVKDVAKKQFDEKFAADGKIKVSMDRDFNFSVTHPQNSNEPGSPLVNKGKNQKIEAMLEMIKAAHAAGIEVEIEITGGSAKTREKLAAALHAHSKCIGVGKPTIKMGQTDKAEDLKSFTGNKESQAIEAKFLKQKAEHQANQLIERSQQLERQLKQQTKGLEKLTSGSADAISNKLITAGIITAGTPGNAGPPVVPATPSAINPDNLKKFVDLDQYKALAKELDQAQQELRKLQASQEFSQHAGPANQKKLADRIIKLQHSLDKHPIEDIIARLGKVAGKHGSTAPTNTATLDVLNCLKNHLDGTSQQVTASLTHTQPHTAYTAPRPSPPH